MYSPPQFEELRLDLLHQLICAHPLGTLVTQDAAGLCADHIPFEIAPATPDAPFGTLRAHVARSNPVWQHGATGAESMVVFQGAQAYVSPAWYAEKTLSGKVVPTFNYAVVHAYGPLQVRHDPIWLLALLERLTQQHEAPRAAPWRVSDAPSDYIDKLLAAIVGIEIPLTRLLGKWKLSQNRPQVDQATIATELARDRTAPSAAMAVMMRARQDMK